LRLKRLNKETNIEELLYRLEADKGGIGIMKKKASAELFYISDLSCAEANILKQDALSIGAELAVPCFVAGCGRERTDGVLMGTRRQLEELIKKERAQPYRLKELSKMLEEHIKKSNIEHERKIMGVLNINEDSFYAPSRRVGKEAINRIEEMIKEGATIIDVGAVSSRPGSVWAEFDEERRRLEPILRDIYSSGIYKEAIFSIDTINPDIARLSFDSGFRMLNDIEGFKNPKNAQVVAEYGASALIMHMQGTSETMQKNPVYSDVIYEIEDFFKSQIASLKEAGVEDVVLDVGIGFGKSLEHNLLLIKHLAHFKYLGYPLLIGASRKSMIDKLSPSLPEDRLAGTIAIHIEALKNGASILRVHDVFAHKQALGILQALDETTIL